MPVLFHQGTFTKASGNNTQTVSGLPFRPRAVIFYTTVASTLGTITDGLSISYGFSDGVNDACVSCAAEDNIATSDCLSNLNWPDNDVVEVSVATIGINADSQDAFGRISSFNNDGFTIIWSASAATTPLIHFMMIGGDDISRVRVGHSTVGTTTTGLKSYTGVGFQPDFLLTVNHGYIKATAVTQGEAVNHAAIGISAMKSPTERWSTMNVIEGGRADSDSWRYKRTDKCFSLLGSDTGTVIGEADFVSFNNDGFTWNYSTAGANITNSVFIYLAIKGGVWDVGSSPVGVTGTTSRTIETNKDARLKGVGFGFAALVAGNDIANNTSIGCYGGTDGTRQSMIAFSDLDAAATMTCVRLQRTDAVNEGLVANATAASSTVFAVASQIPFGTNSFTTNWTSIDANAYLFHYFAVSELQGPKEYGDCNLKFIKNSGGQGTIFG